MSHKLDSVQTSTGAAYGAGGANFMLGLGLNDWLAIIGVVFMILTYLTSLFFQARRDKREHIKLMHTLEKDKPVKDYT